MSYRTGHRYELWIKTTDGQILYGGPFPSKRYARQYAARYNQLTPGRPLGRQLAEATIVVKYGEEIEGAEWQPCRPPSPQKNRQSN